MGKQVGLVQLVLVLGCALWTASAQRIIFGGGGGTVATPPPPEVTSDLGSQCHTPEGTPGLCERLNDCPSLLESRRRRDIAHLKRSVCGKHGKLILLCCPDNVPPPPPPPSPSASDCGLTQVTPPRIVGGDPVMAVGDYPWMVALGYRGRTEYVCGGAVIDERWVLTAAHCLTAEGPIAAQIGDLDLVTTTDDDFLNPPQHIEVDKVIGHPEYKRGFRAPNKGLVNDIALIRLKEDIKFSVSARPICLPDEPEPGPLTGEAVIAGWGITEYRGIASSKMLHAGVNYTDMETCRTNYAGRDISVDLRQHTCASGNDTDRTLPGCSPGDDRPQCQGGVDTCEGDSGGPLMRFVRIGARSRVTVQGVVSFAVGCGNPRFPGIYTRVDQYLEWIEETMKSNSD